MPLYQLLFPAEPIQPVIEPSVSESTASEITTSSTATTLPAVSQITSSSVVEDSTRKEPIHLLTQIPLEYQVMGLSAGDINKDKK